MRNYYKIGANLPGDEIVIPVGEETYEDGENLIDRAQWIRNVATKAPKAQSNLLKVANFVTQEKKTDWKSYFSIGANDV